MDGIVELVGESTEDYDVVLHLRSSSAESSGIERSSTYPPVRPGLEVGEAGDAFHQVGRVLVLISDDSSTLHTQYLLRDVLEKLEKHLR